IPPKKTRFPGPVSILGFRRNRAEIALRSREIRGSVSWALLSPRHPLIWRTIHASGPYHRDRRAAAAARLRITGPVHCRLRRTNPVAQQSLAGQTHRLAAASPGRGRLVRTRPPPRRRTCPGSRPALVGTAGRTHAVRPGNAAALAYRRAPAPAGYNP